MKNLIIGLMVVLATSSTFAKNVTKADTQQQVVLSQEKMSVKPEDLPESVKHTLASGNYAGWEITEAFLITKDDKTQYFEIFVKNGSETSKINLNKDGRKVE